MRINSSNDNSAGPTQPQLRHNRGQKRIVIYSIVGVVIALLGVCMAASAGGTESKHNTASSAVATVPSKSSSVETSSDSKLKQVQNNYVNGVNKPKQKADNKIKDFTPQIKQAMAILYNYSSSDTSNISRATKLLKYATDTAVTTFIPANTLTKKAQQQQSLKVTYRLKDVNVVKDSNGKYDVAVTYNVSAFDQTQQKVDSYTLWVNHDKISSVTSNGSADN